MQVKRWAAVKPGWVIVGMSLGGSNFTAAPTGASTIMRFLQPRGAPGTPRPEDGAPRPGGGTPPHRDAAAAGVPQPEDAAGAGPPRTADEAAAGALRHEDAAIAGTPQLGDPGVAGGTRLGDADAGGSKLAGSSGGLQSSARLSPGGGSPAKLSKFFGTSPTCTPKALGFLADQRQALQLPDRARLGAFAEAPATECEQHGHRDGGGHAGGAGQDPAESMAAPAATGSPAAQAQCEASATSGELSDVGGGSGNAAAAALGGDLLAARWDPGGATGTHVGGPAAGTCPPDDGRDRNGAEAAASGGNLMAVRGPAGSAAVRASLRPAQHARPAPTLPYNEQVIWRSYLLTVNTIVQRCDMQPHACVVCTCFQVSRIFCRPYQPSRRLIILPSKPSNLPTPLAGPGSGGRRCAAARDPARAAPGVPGQPRGHPAGGAHVGRGPPGGSRARQARPPCRPRPHGALPHPQDWLIALLFTFMHGLLTVNGRCPVVLARVVSKAISPPFLLAVHNHPDPRPRPGRVGSSSAMARQCAACTCLFVRTLRVAWHLPQAQAWLTSRRSWLCSADGMITLAPASYALPLAAGDALWLCMHWVPRPVLLVTQHCAAESRKACLREVQS